jgi:uncharacterized protein
MSTRRTSTKVRFGQRTRLPLRSCALVLTCGLAACADSEGGDPGLASRTSAIAVDPALVIAQVYGAGGNTGASYANDFVELFNRSSGPVSLDGLSLQYASAAGTGNFGSAASQLVVLPSGVTLPPGGRFLISLAGGTVGAALPAPDATGTIAMAAAAGKVALVTGTSSLGCNGGSAPCSQAQSDRIVDLVGFGASNFFEGSAPTAAPSAVLSVQRAGGGCTDTNDNAANFATATPQPRNSGSAPSPCAAVGDAAPSVASTVPAAGASNVSAASPLSVTFSEPVNLGAGAITIACSSSGSVSAAVTGGPVSYTVTPSAPLAASEACTVTVAAASVTDVDTDDPPDTMSNNYVFTFQVTAPVTGTPVHLVQGAAHRSPITGQRLAVGPAIVTAVASNGFYMEDVAPDASDLTSEGIFVFTSSAPTVLAGDLVVVTGTVTEFRPGCSNCTASASAFDNLTTTELTSPTIDLRARGQALPPATVLGSAPGQRAVPLSVIEDDATPDVELSGTFDPSSDGLDFYESLEGMRITLDQPSAVGPTAVFSSGDREIPVLGRPDAALRTARGGIIIRATDMNPERVFLSNGLGQVLPTVDVGDRLSGAVTGVLDYSFGNYKLLVSEVLPPVIDAALAPEVTTLSATRSTQLRVGSLNAENLDPGDGAAKFARIAGIIVQNMGAPDIVAVEEVQDNSGATDDGVVAANVTLGTLVSAIQAAGGPSYATTQIDPVNAQSGGEPGGNIRVALLYRSDRGLTFVARGSAGALSANAVNANAGSPQLALSPGYIDPGNSAFSSSRKPLAAEFTFAGESCFVIANHWNSKGGDDPLFGRFQPPVLSSEVQRSAQAQVVSGFVDSLLTADASACVVVLGDLNDFSFSPPLTRLKDVGMVDLVETLPASERYTYVYQGNSQDLDHIVVSPSLAARAQYDIVHVNAEFADQASDHDPAVTMLEFGTTPVLTVSGNPPPVASGGAFSFQVSASGSPQPTFSLSGAPLGMTINASTGVITWQAGVAGTYTFTVRADNGVGSITQTFTVAVTGGLPVPALPWPAFVVLAFGLLALMGGVRTRDA